MGNIFSGSEIVEIGIQIEKNGRDFYKGVLGAIRNQKTKSIFEFLAEEEDKHIKRFQDILSQVKRYEPQEAYPGEYFAYLKVLSDGYVFTKKDAGPEIAKNVRTESEAIDLGIGFEKDSILFYHEMKNFVLEAEKKVIYRLLEEEQAHLRRLVGLKK